MCLITPLATMTLRGMSHVLLLRWSTLMFGVKEHPFIALNLGLVLFRILEVEVYVLSVRGFRMLRSALLWLKGMQKLMGSLVRQRILMMTYNKRRVVG